MAYIEPVSSTYLGSLTS